MIGLICILSFIFALVTGLSIGWNITDNKSKIEFIRYIVKLLNEKIDNLK